MKPAGLLIELLTEELPARGLRELGERFGGDIAAALAKLGFRDAQARFLCFATPRRLALLADGVHAVQPEQRVERRGPAVATGLKNGEPTPALLGFAKSCGVPVQELARASDAKGEYFVHRSLRAGAPLAEHLATVVEQAAKALPAQKLMRWGDSDVQFIRPVHGVVMLWESEVVAGTVLGIAAGRDTAGHRFMGERTLRLGEAADYPRLLLDRGKVIPAFDERASRIRAQLEQHAGGDRLADETLIEEVAALVEWPAVYEGRFDPAFLDVPQECLMLTMKANQKYFPLLDPSGRLRNRFLLVSNMAITDPAFIVSGNERVLRARLADARFFFDQDRKHPLASFVPKLAAVVYHNKLGSQLDRTERIGRIAAALTGELAPGDAELAAAVQRAAHLCKADLLTGMVGEFPELQGTMGMYYARHDGETDAVCRAIEAHYRPRFGGGPLPDDRVGDCVALADKADVLTGIFGLGLVPTGDRDPFGLRRAALGVVRILVEHALPVDAGNLLAQARAQFKGVAIADTVVRDLMEFLYDRMRSYLREKEHAVDEIEAVLAKQPTRFDTLLAKLHAVREFRALPAAESLAAANKRIANILRKSGAGGRVDPALFREVAERALFDSMAALEPQVEQHLRAAEFSQALQRLAGLRDAVDAFFDRVLVNTEEVDVRSNRLGLLTRLNQLMNRVADISRLG